MHFIRVLRSATSSSANSIRWGAVSTERGRPAVVRPPSGRLTTPASIIRCNADLADVSRPAAGQHIDWRQEGRGRYQEVVRRHQDKGRPAATQQSPGVDCRKQAPKVRRIHEQRQACRPRQGQACSNSAEPRGPTAESKNLRRDALMKSDTPAGADLTPVIASACHDSACPQPRRYGRSWLTRHSRNCVLCLQQHAAAGTICTVCCPPMQQKP